jgi:hypothetical protein
MTNKINDKLDIYKLDSSVWPDAPNCCLHRLTEYNLRKQEGGL